jgi:hypothetical protein
MNEKRLIQWLGMVCLLAGLTRIGMTPSSLIWGTDSTPELVCGFVASLLMSVGTIAAYMVQAREAGALGLIATLAVTTGNCVTACMLWASLVTAGPAAMPDGAAFTVVRLVMMVGLTGGTLLFTIVTFRAGVFPRWIVVLLALMLLSMALPVQDNKYFAFFWGLAYVGLGYAIYAGKWKRKTEPHGFQ